MPIIDYEKGVNHVFTVDVDSGKVLADDVAGSPLTAPGEEGIRRLYGIALADPKVADAAGKEFSVSADAIPFQSKTGACSADQAIPHRCLYGTIFTPDHEIYVYADLTGIALTDWSLDAD